MFVSCLVLMVEHIAVLTWSHTGLVPTHRVHIFLYLLCWGDWYDPFSFMKNTEWGSRWVALSGQELASEADLELAWVLLSLLFSAGITAWSCTIVCHTWLQTGRCDGVHLVPALICEFRASLDYAVSSRIAKTTPCVKNKTEKTVSINLVNLP